MTQEKLANAKTMLFIALGIDMAVTALVLFADIWAVGIFNDVRSGATVDRGTLSTLEFWDSFSKVTLLTLIGVGIALVRWLGSCYEYAKENLKLSGFAQEGWKTWGWIVPVFNLFKPYQVISEIYKAGDVRSGQEDGWKTSSGSALLLAWWVFWVASHVVMWAFGKQVLRGALRDDLTLNQALNLQYGSIAICAISLLVGALWFVVAGGLTQRLMARPVRMAVPSDPLPVKQSRGDLTRPTPLMTSDATTESRGMTSHSAIDRQPSEGRPQPTSDAIDLTPSTEKGFDERGALTRIAEEIERQQVDKGLWLKALLEADGDLGKQALVYAKLRLADEAARHAAITAEREHEKREREQREREAAAEAAALAATLEAEMRRLGPEFVIAKERLLSGEDISELDFNKLVERTIQLRHDLDLPLTLRRESLLHIAAKANFWNAAGILLRQGASFETTDSAGNTPLQLAQQNNAPVVVSLLMDAMRESASGLERARECLRRPVPIGEYCARHALSRADVDAKVGSGELRGFGWRRHVFIDEVPVGVSGPSSNAAPVRQSR